MKEAIKELAVLLWDCLAVMGIVAGIWAAGFLLYDYIHQSRENQYQVRQCDAIRGSGKVSNDSGVLKGSGLFFAAKPRVILPPVPADKKPENGN